VGVFGLGLIEQFCAQLPYVSGAHAIRLGLYELRKNKALIYGSQSTLDPRDENVVEKIKGFTRGYGLDTGFICYGGRGGAANLITPFTAITLSLSSLLAPCSSLGGFPKLRRVLA